MAVHSDIQRILLILFKCIGGHGHNGETLGIALMAAVVCVVGAVLICRAKKKKLSKKSTVVIGIAAFIIAIVAVIEIARIPMPL